VEPLERIVAQHGNDPRAPLAAITLGRIELRTLGNPIQAARALQTALALHVPEGLAEDTHALLIESLARSGNHGGARIAYDEYLARFPESDRKPELERWIRAP
jgi:hypothetical protein